MMGENQNLPRKDSIHHVLTHIYSVYFALFLLGVFLDTVFHIDFFSESYFKLIGLILLMLASAIIFWAQKTGRDFKKIKETTTIASEHFCRGPYCYTKIPTQWGLFLLVIGFGIFVDAVFVVITTLVSFFIVKRAFIHKYYKILTKKYGNSYLEYKKLVRF